MAEMKDVDIHEWKMTREIYFLLFVSLMATIGFSAIQGGSSQFTADKFHFDASMIGYSMAMVGITSIVYQGFLVKYVRAVLDEPRMMVMGLALLVIGLSLYAWNPIGWLVFPIVILFPLGMGSIMPSLSALLARDAGKHAGRVMGMNTSVG
jgi:DHA1 family tetracycline resistance protein-like MFS transporter